MEWPTASIIISTTISLSLLGFYVFKEILQKRGEDSKTNNENNHFQNARKELKELEEFREFKENVITRLTTVESFQKAMQTEISHVHNKVDDIDAWLRNSQK